MRREVAALQDELRELTDSVHRDEVARTQQRLRIEQLQAKAVEELGIDPEALVEEFGPHQLVPVRRRPGRATRTPCPSPAPYVRETQEKRLRKAERALQRRSAGSTRSRSRSSRRWRSGTSSSPSSSRTSSSPSATCSTSSARSTSGSSGSSPRPSTTPRRSSSGVFSRLFPGGEGRLILTDPDNMLTTGIEVEARPPGKKIKRLSLLSGGERSLVAVALLVVDLQGAAAARSTSWTRSRRRSTTPTSAG